MGTLDLKYLGVLALASLATLAISQAPAPDPLKVRAVLALERNANLQASPTTLLVRFDPGLSESSKASLRSAAGAKSIRKFKIVPGLELLAVPAWPELALSVLQHRPGVLYAEPDYVVRTTVTPNDTYFGLQWGLHNTGQAIRNVNGISDADMDGPEGWNTTVGDPNFRVAVIDTGTDYNHPDLSGNIALNLNDPIDGVDNDGNGFVDDYRGWDFYSNDNNPMDSQGHGTHTAGTVGAVGNNGIGVAGVAWRCKIVPLRFLGPNGGYTSDAVEAVQYCTMMGIKVSNNSWGGGGYSTALYNAINASKAVGHIFVASAGNDSRNTDSSPAYPASYNLDNIISVAATDNRDRLASFSNWGASSVDVGAPGVDIASTYPNNGYVWMSGTSMAGPHVAGLATLVYGQNPSWTYQQVRQRILDTGRPVSALAGITATGKMPNLAAALAGGSTNTAPTVTITAPATNSSFAEGTSVTFTAEASDSEQGNVSASIAWSSNLDGVLGSGPGLTLSNLSVGTHTVTATATDGSLTGSDSITVTITATPGDPPAAPSNLSVVRVRRGVGLASWSDNSNNETQFVLEREKQNKRGWGNATTITVDANTTSYEDSAGRGYFRYRIWAVNSSGGSAATDWVEVSLN